MKVVITGATGFIGKHLVTRLVEEGYEVYVILRSKREDLPASVQIYIHDNSCENLISWFMQEKFEGLIHLASFYLAMHKEDDISKLIRSNIEFGTHLLEAATQSQVKWFINSGSFWQNYQGDEYNPVNLYAATKEAFEKIAKFYTEVSDMVFVTLMLNDTFGPHDTRDKIFHLWQKIAKSGDSLAMSEGKQLIDISYIDDVINAYMLLLEHLVLDKSKILQNEKFVVSSNQRVTLKELATIFENVTNSKLNIVWGAKPYREREVMIPFRSKNFVPDWQQKYSLQEAISLTMETE